MKLLDTLEEKWTDIERKGDQYDIKFQESQQTLSHVRQQIDQMFNKLQCVPEDLPSGCAVGISDANMLAYLAVIEHRTNELLKIYDAMKEEDDEDFDLTRPNRTAGTSTGFNIKLPSTVEDYSDDDDEDDEDDQRPFTPEELKTKTLKGISKRQKKSRLKSSVAADK